MIALIGMMLAGQAAVAVLPSERERYESYRQCVLAAAGKAAPSETAADTWDRSAKACQTDQAASRLAIEADDLANRADALAAGKPDPAGAPNATTTDQRVAVMDKELAAEIAALRTNATK